MSSEHSSAFHGVTPRWLLQTSKGVVGARYIVKMIGLGALCISLGIAFSGLYDSNGYHNSGSRNTGSVAMLDDGPAELHNSSSHRIHDGLRHSSVESTAAGEDTSVWHRLSSKLSELVPSRKMNPKGWRASQYYVKEQIDNEFNRSIADDADAAPSLAKITIMTGETNENDIYERALKTHSAHNRQHGYPMHILRRPILNDVWSKPAYILSVMLRELAKPSHERVRWLFWVDADTIIINPNVPAETFLPPRTREWEDVHLLVSHDFNGLNNGIFPIRVHAWSVDLLTAILSYPIYRPKEELLFRDQSAMSRILEMPRFARHTALAPQRWFNAYQGEINETIAPFQTRPGDLLVHFAGVPNRDERMEWWLNRAEQHLPEWEVAFKHTSYASETREFWSHLAKKRKQRKQEIKRMRDEADAKGATLKTALKTWGNQLTEEQRRRIDKAVNEVRETFEGEDTHDDIASVRKAMERLKKATAPLQQRIDEAEKLLLKEAHDVLFAAEHIVANTSSLPWWPPPYSQSAQAAFGKLEQAVAHFRDVLLEKPLQRAKLEVEMGIVRDCQRDLEREVESLEREEREDDEQRQKTKEQEEKEHQEEEEDELKEKRPAKSKPDPEQQPDAELVAHNGKGKAETS